MKKVSYVAGAALMALCSCGGGGGQKPEAAPDTVKAVAQEVPVAEMSEHYEITRDATLGEHAYKITINIDADRDLPTVKDQNGREYLDNKVSVRITRDGADFFSRTFTKDSFADFIPAKALGGYILNGMNFYEEKSTARRLCLTAQVGEPGAGEGPAFIVEVPTGGGACSIVVDREQDSNGEKEEGV